MSRTAEVDRPYRMSIPISTKRLTVAALAVTAAVLGVWAAAFPLSFYADFPLPGRHWVSALGPYNEHLTRDVGGLFLALLVLSVWALRHPTPTALRVTGGAWTVFTAEHFVWHVLHLDVFPVADRIGNVVALAAMLLASILLLLPDRPTAEANA
ncbi:hypothetical protein Axi01nite_37250 [Actinoplanes xinjiangensis]|jgi:hypothetical protein|nr:hypothetical protein Axi01nite_37250 [Actinoplanes xinjiangensis]